MGEYAEAPVGGGIVIEVHGNRRRPRLPLPRRHRVVVRLSDEEAAAVGAGANRLGLSRGAFLSAAGVAVARGDHEVAVPVGDAHMGDGGRGRTGRTEGTGGLGPAGVNLDRRTGDAVDDLETQLGRIGNLLNQAVRVAHSTGQVDDRLLGAAESVRRLAACGDALLVGVNLDRRGRAR